MASKKITAARDFPAVEQLLQAATLADAIALLPRPIAAEVVRETVAELKEQVIGGAELSEDRLHDEICRRLRALKRLEMTRVINAAGILVHTNLGRAPLTGELLDSIRETVTGYGNVEFDLSKGQRGHRGAACEKYLATLAEAEAATVVNNNAAALFLILNTLAQRREVIVSRGELVQIGGGFRIPDILRRSGARLCEVGATNITTVADYADAVSDRTALILKVHQSNFRQAGFVDQVPLAELVQLGRARAVPVVNDLGSGVFVDTKDLTGFSEPTVQQSVRAGADLTCFSGDKLLGGVQAGLIVGRADLLARIWKNPLFRAVRVDKVVFAVLEKLFRVYLDGRHLESVRLWQLLKCSESELYRRGKELLQQLGNPSGLSLEASQAFVGGGALPESAVASVAICFDSAYKATTIERKFRQLDPPVIGRVENDRFLLDLRAILPEDWETLRGSIRLVIS